MQQIFGDYQEELSSQAIFLKLRFSPSELPIKQRWRNNGLSATYIAEYINIVSPDGISKHRKNMVSYVANELLENAMKFNNDKATEYNTRMDTLLVNETFIFRVTNTLNNENQKKLKKFIDELLQTDPFDMYFLRMEANADEQNHGHSGLGFLSMICDYSAKLGWKFETINSTPQPVNTVTTMVTLPVSGI